MPSAEELLINKAVEIIERHVRTCVTQSTANSDNELEQLSQAVYVWPQGQYFAAPSTAAPLLRKMNQFIQDKNKRVAVILGNPGAGKTTFAKRWLKTCLDQRVQGQTQALPVFIALSSINTISTLMATGEDLLAYYLEKKLGLSIECINQVKQDLPLIVFLDGYDEITYFGNFYQDNHWHEWKKAQFVISTRPEKFGEHLRPNELESLLKLRFAPNSDNNKLELYELQDLTKENIQEFIRQWVAMRHHTKHRKQVTEVEIEEKKEETPHCAIEASPETLYQALQELKGLMELANNPVILSLILYALPALYQKHQALSEAERQQLMRIDVYNQFVNEWFKSQATRVMQKLQQNHYKLKEQLDSTDFDARKYLHRYTQNLAYHNLKCSEAGKLNVEITADTTLHLDLLRSNGDACSADQMIARWTVEDRQAFLKILRSGCLLKCDSTSFKFFHKSLIEYFTQAHMVQDVGLIDQALFRANQTGELKSENDFTSLSLNNMLLREVPNVLSFLAERAGKDSNFKETLYQILRLSKKHLDVGKAAANAIMVLKRINAPLNKESWKKIKIPGADLSRAILHNIDFREADLQGVNFANAYLEGANLEGAFLSHCDWGSAPFIPFKAAISALACTWDDEYMLVGDIEGTIHYVELASEIVKATVTHKPWHISASNKEKLREYAVNALAVDGFQKKESVFFASACQHSIFLWNIKKQKYLGALEGHTATVTHLTYTVGGQRLASSDEAGNVRLWDPIQRVALQQIPFKNSPQKKVMFLAYTSENTFIGITIDACIALEYPDSRMILLQEHETVKADKEEKLALSSQLLAASYHPTVDRLAVLSKKKVRDDNGIGVTQVISYWDIKTKRCVMSVDVSEKKVVALAALSANTFALGYSNGETQLYGQEEGFASRSSTEDKTITWLISTADGHKWIAAASDKLYFREKKDVRWGMSDIGCSVVAVTYQSNPFFMLLAQAQDKQIYEYDLKQGSLNKKNEADVLFSSSLAKFSRIYYLLLSLPRQRLLTYLMQCHLLLSQKQTREWEGGVLELMLVLKQALEQELEKKRQEARKRALELTRPLEEQELARNFEMALYLPRIEHQEQMQAWNHSQEQEQERALEQALEQVNKVSITPAMRAQFSFNINCLTYCSQTQQVALGSGRGSVELLTLKGDVVQRIEIEGSAPISVMVYSPDGILLAVASEDKMLHCFDLSHPKPLCVARLSTLEFTIRTLQFTQNSAGELELHAGAFKGNQLQSLVFQPMSRSGSGPASWQLVSAWNKDFVPRWRGANLDGSTGLTQTQFGFLTQQGATGQPAAFFHTGAMNNEVEEHRDLQEFENLLKRLKSGREGLPQERSLFHGTYPVSLDSWVVLIFRSSKIASAERSRGLQFFNSSSGSSASDSTHHAYGLLEGLDVQGRRVFIRIDLVGPDKPASYARIKNKCSVATGATEADAKKAFLALFADGRSGTPQEVTYHVLGAISRDSVHRLCRTFIDDQNRQYSKKENWPATRIHYALRGGAEQKVPEAVNQSGLSSISRPDSPQIHVHNCLTYLRWRLGELSEKQLDLPKSWRDFLYVDPQHVLPRQSHPGFDARNKVHTVLLTAWDSPPTPSMSLR